MLLRPNGRKELMRYSRQDENMVPGFDYAKTAGCTATVALITPEKLYVANAGDSRCIAALHDGSTHALSHDHKPEVEGEKARIEAAGHTVEKARVDGKIAISRAIGDWLFKSEDTLEPHETAITAKPEVIVHERTSELDFIVLACDGIWDMMRSEEVVAYVKDD